jgi:KDO2-lipid IV(A) lauroyltransferase
MTLAARLSEVAGVTPCLPGPSACPAGRLPPAPGADAPGDTEARAAAINREMEAQIRENPAQYLWGYNRYKRPSGRRRACTPGTGPPVPDTP